jgi:hypothetical protein
MRAGPPSKERPMPLPSRERRSEAEVRAALGRLRQTRDALAEMIDRLEQVLEALGERSSATSLNAGHRFSSRADRPAPH